MTVFVEVAVNLAQIERVYHYHLPVELVEKVQPGCLVVVPFGAQTVQGIVLRLLAEAEVPQTRPVQELVDPLPVVTHFQMDLARWMADHYLSTLAACLDIMLPPGLSQHTELVVSPRSSPERLPTLEHSAAAEQQLSLEHPLQARILALLKDRGSLRARQLDDAFPRQNWRSAVQALARRGWVHTQTVLPPPSVRPKIVRTVQLACEPAEIPARLGTLKGNGDVIRRRAGVMEFLQRESWPVELPWVYANTGGNLTDIERLAEAGLIDLKEEEAWRDPLANVQVVLSEAPVLTDAQSQALHAVQAALRSSISRSAGQETAPFLLHGVTGSGKTEIYLQAVAETLRQERQALILVPEIALTPQTVRRFLSRFPGRVGVIHSRLSPGERFDTWRRVRSGQLGVIVGPRSALFAPLPRPGLIVVDECHDESFYQTESPPYYHTAATAVAYARLAGAVALLGSATPDIVQTFQSSPERPVKTRWQVLRMPNRLLAHRQAVEQQASALGLQLPPLTSQGQTTTLELPPVEIVDMRTELKAGNRSIFSSPLQEELQRVFAAGQQAILFLNRRGTATYVFCRDCGAALRCPRCDRPLTFHSPQVALTCHTCGYQRQVPRRCPACGSDQIRQMGTGTEKVEEELKKLLPEVRCLRWDAETTRQKDAHEVILGHFSAHRADVLVGTQMLAKGLDLPLVTLVGVILAESGLNLPDYRAPERTFQVLTQVIGRAGRSPLGGKAILQTFQPEQYAIQAAARHDYDGFYQQELALRRQLAFPPFYHLVRLEYRHERQEEARLAAENLAERLRHWIESSDRRATSIIGPAPCFFQRINSQFRWQVILRGPDPAGLLRSRMKEASAGSTAWDAWRIQVDPPSLL